MASWKYAVLFPYSRHILRPAEAVPELKNFPGRIDRSLRLCVPFDEEGHLGDYGDEVLIGSDLEGEISSRLIDGQSFSIGLEGNHNPATLHFLQSEPNPHIFFGWHGRLFRSSPVDYQEQFWSTIRSFARHCNAAYVFIVDDVNEEFADHFLVVDETAMFELGSRTPWLWGLEEVWIQTGFTKAPPLGLEYGQPNDIGDGFVRYQILNQAEPDPSL